MSGIISARAWGKVWAYRSTFLLGLLNTVETAFFAILLSLALGVIFGLMAASGKKVLQIISRVYVEIMQNTPILLQLCFFYYALAFSGHSIGILPTGIVALGVYTGAYMAEVVRGASRPSLRDSSRRLCPRDSLMWSGCIILSCPRASRSFCRPW